MAISRSSVDYGAFPCSRRTEVRRRLKPAPPEVSALDQAAYPAKPVTTVCGPVGTACAVTRSKPASWYIASSSRNV